MRFILPILLSCAQLFGQSPGPFAPAAGIPGSRAIHKDSSLIESWAQVGWLEQRGWLDIADKNRGRASHGDTNWALGPADGQVISLGDSGVFGYHLPQGIWDQAGAEFAIFENSFSDVFLELAFVEVSKDGLNYLRFPAQSLLDTNVQTGTFGPSDPTRVANLAGKYRADYGVPFDLKDIVDLDTVHYIRIIDVVGSIDPQWASRDSQGRIINDPYPTAFASGGFDLDALALLKPNSLSADATLSTISNAYPNPATHFVIFPKAQKLKLYTSSGKLLRVANSEDLNLAGLPKGYYLLEATFSSGGRQMEKLYLK